MITRNALKADVKELKEMWRHSFNYSDAFIDWYFSRVFSCDNTVVCEENKRLLAGTSIVPYSLNISELPTDSAYIAGFASLPETRTTENLRELLINTLLMLKDKGHSLVFTVPYSYKFYETYGFRTVCGYKQYNITTDDIPNYTLKGSIERCKIDEATIKNLSSVYNAHMQGKNSYVMRTEENWKLILEDVLGNFNGYCAVLKEEDGSARGYILYVISDGHMGIYEMAYTDRQAYESLYAYIKAYSMQLKNVSIKTDRDDLSYLDFCDKRNAISYMPFVTARIVDVRAIFEQLAKNFGGNVRIQVIDRLIDENNITVELSENSVIETSTAPEVVTDIGTLTQLFMGYISPSEAARLNMIAGNTALLDGLFEKKNNYIGMLCY